MSKRGRGGSSGGKFRISLALPVAAVMNCADNTGKWVISGETNQIIKPSNHGFCLFLVYRCALGSYLQILNLFVLRPIY